MEWIKVREKMPELTQKFDTEGQNSERVLVVDKTRKVYFATFINDIRKMKTGEKVPVRFWATVDMSGHKHLDVTHWMKIPELPQVF